MMLIRIAVIVMIIVYNIIIIIKMLIIKAGVNSQNCLKYLRKNVNYYIVL